MLDASGEGRRLVVIEDNPDDELMVLRALKRAMPRLSVDVARDGEEALTYLLDPNVKVPHLVLVDLKLPKVGGMEVVRKVRLDPRYDSVPLIAFTSSREPLDVKGCYRAGATSYLQKPVDYDQFIEQMRIVTDYWFRLHLGP